MRTAHKTTGLTQRGNVRDVKVERVGIVTIYQRGLTFCLYYRSNGRSVRHACARDLELARQHARQVCVQIKTAAEL